MPLLPALLVPVVSVTVTGLMAILLWRRLVNLMVDKAIRRMMSEPYTANLVELMAGFGHNPIRPTMENELRAHSGTVLHRPMGTARRPRTFHGLMFNPAQLQRSPLPPDAPVTTAVTLGPRAQRPLFLEMPLLVSGMGFGVGISEQVAIALARGSADAGTACNAGHGPLLPAVRQEARSLIIQYTGSPWTTDPAVLRLADMVEIRFGQGAWGAMGSRVKPEDLPDRARELMGLHPGEAATLHSGAGNIHSAEHLRRLVQQLREMTGGVPIGIKLAATNDLERDLDSALAAGVDVIAIDGAEGGTQSAPPILADDFGLPTLDALVRAVRHLERVGARNGVSLIISGGLHNPGDYLKCLALGTDAVYLGSPALFAAAHKQVALALPWEPPTQVMMPKSARADQFDVEEGAKSLQRFLQASVEEMAVGARALGKDHLHAVSRDDLFALDGETARVTGIPLAPGWAEAGTRDAATGAGRVVTRLSGGATSPRRGEAEGAAAHPQDSAAELEAIAERALPLVRSLRRRLESRRW